MAASPPVTVVAASLPLMVLVIQVAAATPGFATAAGSAPVAPTVIIIVATAVPRSPLLSTVGGGAPVALLPVAPVLRAVIHTECSQDWRAGHAFLLMWDQRTCLNASQRFVNAGEQRRHSDGCMAGSGVPGVRSCSFRSKETLERVLTRRRCRSTTTRACCSLLRWHTRMVLRRPVGIVTSEVAVQMK